VPNEATGIADSHQIRRQIPNDHACANLSATVVWYEILPGVSLTIVICAMSNTSFMSSLVSAFHGLVLGYEISTITTT
jgi:hypothetical protein